MHLLAIQLPAELTECRRPPGHLVATPGKRTATLKTIDDVKNDGLILQYQAYGSKLRALRSREIGNAFEITQNDVFVRNFFGSPRLL